MKALIISFLVLCVLPAIASPLIITGDTFLMNRNSTNLMDDQMESLVPSTAPVSGGNSSTLQFVSDDTMATSDPSLVPQGGTVTAALPAVPEGSSIAMIGSGLVFLSLVASSTRNRRKRNRS